MKVISVIPIIKGPLQKELTYFSSKNIDVGDIVSVLVRKKEVLALATHVTDLASQKTAIRGSDFELKKIITIHSKNLLDTGFIEAVRKTAEYHVLSVGATLFRLIPQSILGKSVPNNKTEVNPNPSITSEILAYQASSEDRLSFYRTYIRECFAKKTSLFICLPTSKEAEDYAEILSKGIEQYLFLLHGDLSPKNLLTTEKMIVGEQHPIVVIGTPQFLYRLTNNTGAIILEHESSPLYKTFVEPFFDIRTFVRFLAEKKKITLILADTILQTETIWEVKEGLLETLMPLNFRFHEKNNRLLIDSKDIPEGASWSPITPQLLEIIKTSIENKKRVFLFTLRKGLAPFTVCNDCKKTLLCKTCETPLTLYKQKNKEERIFVCNTCKDITETLQTCPYCNSWNLKPLGIGTEHVEEYIRKQIPESHIFVLDQTTATTKNQAKKIIRDFESTPGGILIGTEMTLHYDLKKIPTVAVTSFDSLFGIPSFRIHERILHLLIHLENISEEAFIVQTKNIQSPILQSFDDKTFIQYYNNEIKERESFSYPPFTTLIKIIPDAKTSKVEIKKIAEEFFGEYKPNLFTTTYKKTKVPAILLKIPREKWNPNTKQLDEKLKNSLFGLPLTWTIQVDPEQT